VFIGVLLPTYSPQARADWWQDMWKTPDQQAMQAFNKNEYEQAANTFDDDLWQGTAHYKNQNYQAALESFTQVKPADQNYTDATYNTGNALAQLGEIDQAIAAYEKVLQQQPEHEEALANKTLLERLKNQQEQEQEQQDQSGEQSEKNEDSQQDGQQSDEKQDQEGKQSQDPQQSDNSEQSDSEPEASEQQSQAEKEQQEKQEAEQQKADQAEAEKQKTEQEQQALQKGEEELTDEQREQMQRMQNLLNRVPDDPAFLLKRKMQIESQRRKSERLPTNIQGNW
jgi:Ca-activated chloride channel family protein